jgi:spermidine synthase
MRASPPVIGMSWYDPALGVMALVSASLLGWEVLLTRLASLRYHFHFGHLAVSNGLLGIGIAGVILAVTQRHWQDTWERWLTRLCAGYSASLVVAAAVLWALPVHRGSMGIEGTISFVTFGLASALPFFLGGGAIGLLLSVRPKNVHRLYSVDLIAAGLGCLGVVFALPWLGAGGMVALFVVMALIATAISAPPLRKPLAVAILPLMVMIPKADDAWPAPSKVTGEVLSSTWTSLSRVDVVTVDSATIRARGAAAPHVPLPEQVEIMQDGSASTLLSNFTAHPEALALLDQSLFTAAAQIQTKPSVLVIGFGGGDDVWAALHRGAASVDAVDLNAAVLAAHEVVRPQWSSGWINDPRVSVSISEGRSHLMRTQGLYDRVQLTGIDTWAALASGAYMLAENYLYTTESFQLMLDHLAPGGILQITRMAAEMETLRVLTQVHTALGGKNTDEFARSVVVLGSVDSQVATLVRPDGFTDQQIDALGRWAQSAGISILHLPGQAHTGLISTFVRSPDKVGFIDSFPRNIAPTTDDSPYFFNFTRWSRPAIAASTIREPTHISQGNPMFVVAHLVWSTAVAAFFLLLAVRRTDGPGLGRGWLYFGGIGLGFILLELTLIQKLTLLLGHPMRALSVTLAALLLASGVGSLLAKRVRSVGWVGFGVALWVVTAVAALPTIEALCQAAPLPLRVLAALVLILPLGLLLGIPFAWGLHRIGANRTPMAWAVNAFFTVIGAGVSVVLSMNLGFTMVWILGAACYGVALGLGRIEA